MFEGASDPVTEQPLRLPEAFLKIKNSDGWDAVLTDRSAKFSVVDARPAVLKLRQ